MADVIVSKDGSGAEMMETSGLIVTISNSEMKITRRKGDEIFSKLGYIRMSTWSSKKFGWIAVYESILRRAV